MYKSLKSVVTALIPKKFLQRHEFTFRKIITLKYLGNKHQCQICKTKLNQFVVLDTQDLLCPACGSLNRTRRLYQLLLKDEALNGNVLHFSPSRSLYRKFKKLTTINYYSSDYGNQFVADYNFDIRSIDCEDNFFDTIICYHILEHIIEDEKAIKELYRVLKPNGICYIQTPFKEGDIYEDYTITSEKDRLLAFGQEDHVRVYSVNGLQYRLEDSGFKVVVKSFSPEKEDFYLGYQSPETVLIVSK